MNFLRKVGLGLSVVLTAIMPLRALAVDSVVLETQTHVANVTGGVVPNYQKSVGAKVDDVVRAEVYYHNREDAHSGKVANNLTVKIDVPTGTGGTQPVTGHVSADNATMVADSASVVLADPNSHLEYIPGTAVWTHNTAATTDDPKTIVSTPISDAIVTSGQGLRLENEKPCFNYEATVTIEMRVKAPAISLVKQVKVFGSTDKFAVTNTAKAGDTLYYVLIVKNLGNQKLTQVQVGDILPANETYVPNSTELVNSTTGSAGIILTDERITKGGITIADMAVGSTQYVYFKAKLASADAMACGDNSLKNTASAKANGTPQIVNFAYTVVNKVCASVTPPPPVTPPSVTPPTTPVLPATGAEGALAGMFGTAGIGYSLRAYLRSKRSLLDSLRR